MLYILDYYKFLLRSIDSFSDINTPVIVVGTRAEKKSEKVRLITKTFICFSKPFAAKLHLEWVMHATQTLFKNGFKNG